MFKHFAACESRHHNERLGFGCNELVAVNLQKDVDGQHRDALVAIGEAVTTRQCKSVRCSKCCEVRIFIAELVLWARECGLEKLFVDGTPVPAEIDNSPLMQI